MLGDWVRDDVAPAVQTESGLAKILGSIGYECRNRNHLASEKLSEHAKGNAVDLRGLVLRDGRQILIQQQAEKPAFLARLKTSACARFGLSSPGPTPRMPFTFMSIWNSAAIIFASANGT